MAGVGLGGVLLNVCFFAVGSGLNDTMDSLISQANGAGHFKMCGIYLNRARCIVTLILFPIAIIFLFSDIILIRLAQDPTISKMARNYVTWAIPGSFALIQFDSTKRFL